MESLLLNITSPYKIGIIAFIGLAVFSWFILEDYKRRNRIKRREQTIRQMYNDKLWKLSLLLFNSSGMTLCSAFEKVNEIEGKYIELYGTTYMYQKQMLDWIERHVKIEIETQQLK